MLAPASQGMHMTAAVTAYLTVRERDGAALRTLECLRSSLMLFVAAYPALRIGEVRDAHIREWLWRLEVAPSTKRDRYSTLRSFFSWAHQNGMCAENPVLRVARPSVPRRLPRALEHDAVSALLRACPDNRARLIVMLMVGEGLRRSEAAGLEIGDISFSHHAIRVYSRKTQTERMLPLTPPTRHALGAYLREWPATNGPLIRSYNAPYPALQPTWLTRIVSKAMYDAGIKERPYDGKSAHALRHTAATDTLDRCGDIRIVQNMLGHASLTSTHIYTRLRHDVEQLREAMNGRDYD